jgi:hypothetical protein
MNDEVWMRHALLEAALCVEAGDEVFALRHAFFAC